MFKKYLLFKKNDGNFNNALIDLLNNNDKW